MAAEMDWMSSSVREAVGGTKRLRDALRYLMKWSQKNQRPFAIEELPFTFQQATGVDTRAVMIERWLKPLAE
jgi:hypothetical protein